MSVIFSNNVSSSLFFFFFFYLCYKKGDKNMCRALIETEKVSEVVFVFEVQVILWYKRFRK